MLRSFVVVVALASWAALAGTKIIQNDRYPGSGPVQQIGFAEYEGAAVLFTPAPAEYPFDIVAVDVLAVPYGSTAPGSQGAWLIDLWDESMGTLRPPMLFDGGVYRARVNQQGIGLTTSTSMFNRFTLPQPVHITAGGVFVSVAEQTSSAMDFVTIGIDTGPMRTGNWFFDGAGGFVPVDLPDGGTYTGVRGNWIIRLVVAAPDLPISVTSITPATAPTTATTLVTIEGANFELGAKAFVGTTELTLRQFMTTTLQATVPSGIPPGTYDVKVRNLNGLEGVLRSGFVVTAEDGGVTGGGSAGGGSAAGGSAASGGGSASSGGGSSTGTVALSVDAITPAEAYADDETKVSISGSGFAQGAQVFLGPTLFDPVEVKSASVISLTVPAKSVPVGAQDVVVLNLSGARATLPKAFTVKTGSRAKAAGCSCDTVDFAFPLLALALVFRLNRARRPC